MAPRAPTLPIASGNKLLLRALGGTACERPPFWLMRQAGRYLPEYRAVRGTVASFMELCLTPELAVEVTLQPVRRFAMDGAILFSDILVVPYGLGQSVSFEEGHGPVLEPLRTPADFAKLTMERLVPTLEPVYEAIRLLRRKLPAETALIGFVGAPWTLAAYMIEGGSSRDFAEVKGWAYREPESFARLIDLLIDATALHLSTQIAAGAEVVQIFDSWAGVLPDDQLRRWGLEPTREVVRRVKTAHPDVPVIVFPRGVGAFYLDYAQGTGANALSLDTSVPIDWAAQALQPHVVLQGNLDPRLLVVGGEPLLRAIRRILGRFGHGRFVFNLGHGVLPPTPLEHVALLAATIRDWKS
ncbi:MAG: uroporphyrinogen decarboxylase [Dongiaceae bacterium]